MMEERKARIKYVQGGTVVEVYSEQQKKWYRYTDVLPKSDALQICKQEGFEVLSVR